MSSVNEAMYSRNSDSTVWRSSGQRASVMRIAMSPANLRSAFSLQGAGIKSLRVHRIEELAIGLGRAQLVEQEVDRIHRAHRIEDAAQDVHLLELLRIGEQFFLAGAGARDVDRRERALVGHLAVEDELGVAGALEFLEDHFVHARAGIDQGGRDDGQRAAFLDIARRTEEALWPLQSIRVDAAGEHLAG